MLRLHELKFNFLAGALLAVLAYASSGPSAIAQESNDPIVSCFKFHLGVFQSGKLTAAQISHLEIQIPHADYYSLTGGHFGDVYRVVPNDHSPSFSLKQYNNKFPHDPVLERDSDYLGLIFLEAKLSDQGITIVKAEKLGKVSLKLPDIKGQNLAQAMVTASLTDAERKHLAHTWNRFVEKADQVFFQYTENANLGKWGTSLDTLFATMNTEMGNIRIFLKPDNIIVEDKTGKLFLIDPF